MMLTHVVVCYGKKHVFGNIGLCRKELSSGQASPHPWLYQFLVDSARIETVVVTRQVQYTPVLVQIGSGLGRSDTCPAGAHAIQRPI